MDVYASRQLQIRVADLRQRAKAGDAHAETTLRLVGLEIAILRRLDAEPDEETPDLKTVRRSGKYVVWRVSHPHLEGYAVRTIVWFTPQGQAVLACYATDKAQMGNLFYQTVGERADQVIDEWLRDRPEGLS
ncbi:MAG: hypothetical protein FWF02_14620 [Micrococcales bacterium]|nr:hypothetical protein [Micrococcales bacterium]MCL2668912.1 hypothetical protein [Micrococcales bacterium]